MRHNVRTRRLYQQSNSLPPWNATCERLRQRAASPRRLLARHITRRRITRSRSIRRPWISTTCTRLHNWRLLRYPHHAATGVSLRHKGIRRRHRGGMRTSSGPCNGVSTTTRGTSRCVVIYVVPNLAINKAPEQQYRQRRARSTDTSYPAKRSLPYRRARQQPPNTHPSPHNPRQQRDTLKKAPQTTTNYHHATQQQTQYDPQSMTTSLPPRRSRGAPATRYPRHLAPSCMSPP